MPDFRSSELTLGPTFSTLLKLKSKLTFLERLSLIFSITVKLLSFFSNLIRKSFSLPNFLTLTSPDSYLIK